MCGSTPTNRSFSTFNTAVFIIYSSKVVIVLLVIVYIVQIAIVLCLINAAKSLQQAIKPEIKIDAVSIEK
jgi:hypothetical protein